MYNYLLTMLMLFILVGLSSCQNIVAPNNQQMESQHTDICIPPIESFVYSVSPDLSQWPGEAGMQISPNWKVETDLPEDYNLIMAREANNDTELWFSQYLYNEYNPQTPWTRYTRYIHIFTAETKKLKSVSAEVEGSGVFARDLFVAPDGSIWAQNDIAIINSIPSGSNYPILSRFNDVLGQFEFVDEAQSIPFSHNKNIDDIGKWVSTVMDETGVIWFIVPEDAIYSYDPVVKKTKKWAEIPELASFYPVVSFDGTIYFLVSTFSGGYVPTTSDIMIYQFSPETGLVELVSMRLDPWPLFSSLLVDSQGRLWAGGLAYRDVDRRVYQLERSSIFLTNAMETGFDYRWGTPEILMESSDGRIWFRSRNGIAWLDLDEQKWCWLSTSQSKIIEDQGRNLWMTAYGKLYRTQIVPQK